MPREIGYQAYDVADTEKVGAAVTNKLNRIVLNETKDSEGLRMRYTFTEIPYYFCAVVNAAKDKRLYSAVSSPT